MKKSITKFLREQNERMPEEQFSTDTVNRMPVAVVLVETGTGTIVHANPDALRMFGYRLSDMLGKEIELLVPLALRSDHYRLRRAFVENGDQRPMSRVANLSAMRKDGSVFDADIGSSISGDRIVVVIRDVSALRSAEREAHNEATAGHRRLLKLLNASPFPCFLIDRAGIMTFHSQSVRAVLGYTNEMIGHKWHKFVIRENQGQAMAIMKAAIANPNHAPRHFLGFYTVPGARSARGVILNSVIYLDVQFVNFLKDEDIQMIAAFAYPLGMGGVGGNEKAKPITRRRRK